MATFKCKMCGGALEITENQTVCECEYCGSKQTVPVLDEEKKAKLYERANKLRMNCEFDKAASVYESIVADYSDDAEGYWGLVLCRYGIEYVDDPATGKKIPTCHRSSFDSIMDDTDFDLVMENSDTLAREVYREQAKQIEEIRKGIIEVSGREEPYDIFICYKETDENGERTLDSVMAQDIYDVLTGKGYRVFFSRITLEDKLGVEYEPYIFAALNSAKVMLAFGTKYDYYNAVWVKNEWSRYLKLMTTDKEKHLIPCFKNIDAYDIPKEFAKLQAQDMGKVGADQDLIRGISKILRPETEKTLMSNSSPQDVKIGQIESSDSKVDALIQRAYMECGDCNYEEARKYIDDALNINPAYPATYLAKALILCYVNTIDDFIKVISRKIFATKKVDLSPDCEIADVIKNKYILGDQFNQEIIDSINISFGRSYESEIEYLKSLKCTDICEQLLIHSEGCDEEYIREIYDNYKRYRELPGNKNEYIVTLLQKHVKEKIEKEERRISVFQAMCSDKGIDEIIEEANHLVEEVGGEELDRRESDYQRALSEWNKKEEEKLFEYAEICKDIECKWSAIYKEKVKEWEEETSRLMTAYELQKEKYESEKIVIEKNNNSVSAAYNRALDEYIKNRVQLKQQIEEMYKEREGLNFLKKKKKDELTRQITLFETELESMKKNEPQKSDFGEIMLMPIAIEEPRLPLKPENKIVYPKKPVQAEKPKRDTIKNIDGVAIFCSVLEKRGGDVKAIRNISRAADSIFMGIGPDGKPLRWNVLAKNKDAALLITENIIDMVAYHYIKEDITWEKCTLRKYLNGSFIENTFDEYEKKQIIQAKLQNKANEYVLGGNDTVDSVFCLSIDEANEYEECGDLEALPTDYCKKKALEIVNANVPQRLADTNWEGGWWLRSPACYSAASAATVADGYVQVDGFSVDNRTYTGIRPSMWVDIAYLKSKS